MNDATKRFAEQTKKLIELHEKRVSERNAEFDAKYPFLFKLNIHSTAYSPLVHGPIPERVAAIGRWIGENIEDDAWAYDATRRLFGFVDADDLLAFTTKFGDLL